MNNILETSNSESATYRRIKVKQVVIPIKSSTYPSTQVRDHMDGYKLTGTPNHYNF